MQILFSPFFSCQDIWDNMPWSHGYTLLRTVLLFIVFSLSSIQSLSCVQLFVTPWTAAHQASLSITNSQSLLKHLSVESVMPSNHLILFCPLLLPPSIFSSIKVFSNKSILLIRWPKYWNLLTKERTELGEWHDTSGYGRGPPVMNNFLKQQHCPGRGTSIALPSEEEACVAQKADWQNADPQRL